MGHLLAVRNHASCGALQSCAITPNREVVCWSASTSTRLPLTDVTQLVAGDEFHCALDSKGAASCWGLNACAEGSTPLQPEPIRPDAVLPAHAGAAKTMLADGWTVCLSPAKGPTLCHQPRFPRETPTKMPTGIRAITGGGCGLLANGLVRCDLGSPGNGHPRYGLVVFPGVYRDVAEGGFNPGYYGVQHCVIDPAGGVSCCKDLRNCKGRIFERRKLPRPAVDLVGTPMYVAARLDNGNVYAWKSTIRMSRVPFAHDPSGLVSALPNTIEIAGGGGVLCARLEAGVVKCIGGDFGEGQAAIVHVEAR